MRTLILGLAAVVAVALPASAAEWGRYANARYGYAVDVPPGFTGQGEADNGDGQRFVTADGRQVLRAWGTYGDGPFAAEAQRRLAASKADGWTITYETVSMLSASWSGVKGERVVYSRAIASCGGARWAFFSLEYDKADLAANDAVVERLVKSFKAAGPC